VSIATASPRFHWSLTTCESRSGRRKIFIFGEPLEYVSGWKGYAVNPKNSKTSSRM